MSNGSLRAALASGLFISALGCSKVGGHKSVPLLVGGTAIPENQFQSTIGFVEESIFVTCTGAKIGAHHFLTAAHCLTKRDETGKYVLDEKWQSGKIIDITTENVPLNPEKLETLKLTIKTSHVIPEFEGIGLSPDVAVISVIEETPHIPTAKVDFEPVKAEESIAIQGFGCEDLDKISFKNTLNGSLSKVTPGPFPYMFFTEGIKGSPEHPILCPGDSGGPAYRNDGTEKNIVGINSTAYGFDNERTNAFTRLDKEVDVDIQGWLTKILLEKSEN